MSSEVIARVQAFYRKALELSDKGHLLRAANYYGRAAEAARDLGPDNLVTVEMQQSQAAMLRNYVGSVADPNTSNPLYVIAAYRAECISLLSAVVAALERRRVAGTLLEGKCSAAEEAWYTAELRDAGHSSASAAGWAPLVGYDTYLLVARNTLCLLANARSYAGECSATQFEAFAQHVAHAADLMPLPRSFGMQRLGIEPDLTATYTSVMSLDLGAIGLDARLVQLLTEAWLRLQRSGVLETRGILDQIQQRKQSTASERDNRAAAIHAALTAPGLRSCALAGCGAKEAHPQHFKRCSACQAVVYCSKEHQLEAWPAHKAACKAARKAKAAAANGAGPDAA